MEFGISTLYFKVNYKMIIQHNIQENTQENNETCEQSCEHSQDGKHQYIYSNGFYVCKNCGECIPQNQRMNFYEQTVRDNNQYNSTMSTKYMKEQSRIACDDITKTITAILQTYSQSNTQYNIPQNIFHRRPDYQPTNIVIDITNIIKKINPNKHNTQTLIKIMLCMILHNQDSKSIKKHIQNCQQISKKYFYYKNYNQIAELEKYETEINEIRNIYNKIKYTDNTQIDNIIKHTINNDKQFKLKPYNKKIRYIYKIIPTKKLKQIFKQFNNFD